MGLHYARHLKIKGIEHLSLFKLSILLIRSGNIELNPGPSTANSESVDELIILNYFPLCIIIYKVYQTK